MEKKLVAIVSNDPAWTYNLRREVIEGLLSSGYRVALIVGYGEKLDPLIEMGCEHYDVPLERHGMNPIHELQLIGKYRKVLKQIRPDAVLTYTLKPNSYAGYLCRKMKIPYLANITGLGNPFTGGIVQKISFFLLKNGVKKADVVFFQNTENRRLLLEKKIVVGKHRLLPGSGVNLQSNRCEPYPEDESEIGFLYVGRVLREKGIEQLLACAKAIHEKYPQTVFRIAGGYDDEKYRAAVEELEKTGAIEYLGFCSDIHSLMAKHHAIIHPSFYFEGMSNVLLEAASCGRPVITTTMPGCAETFDEGVSGFGVEPQNAEALIAAVEKFLALSNAEKAAMGLAGRKKVETQFDRQIVVKAYLDELKLLFDTDANV